MFTLHIPIILRHNEVEAICTLTSTSDTVKDNLPIKSECIKLSVLPLFRRALALSLLIKIVQIDLLSMLPICPDIIEAKVGLKIVDAIVPAELLTGFEDLHTFAKSSFVPHLLQSTSRAGHFDLGWRLLPQK